MPVILIVLFLILPISAGIIGSRRFALLANFFLMMVVFQAGLTAFILFRDPGRFQFEQLALLIPGVGILPGIGRFSGISPGGLIYPLIFALLAILFNVLRRFTHH
jgi:hypothetical protein